MCAERGSSDPRGCGHGRELRGDGGVQRPDSLVRVQRSLLGVFSARQRRVHVDSSLVQHGCGGKPRSDHGVTDRGEFDAGGVCDGVDRPSRARGLRDGLGERAAGPQGCDASGRDEGAPSRRPAPLHLPLRALAAAHLLRRGERCGRTRRRDVRDGGGERPCRAGRDLAGEHVGGERRGGGVAVPHVHADVRPPDREGSQRPLRGDGRRGVDRGARRGDHGGQHAAGASAGAAAAEHALHLLLHLGVLPGVQDLRRLRAAHHLRRVLLHDGGRLARAAGPCGLRRGARGRAAGGGRRQAVRGLQ